MNYEQAMEYIHAVQWAGHKPGLTRTRTLLAALGDPHKKLQFVHVAGTNGKGSTAASVDELYLFLSNMTTIEYLRNCMKRVRKKESAMVIASQNVDDFLIPEVRELTKPLFAIPTHQFLFNAGNIEPKAYTDTLQLEMSEFSLIKYPERGSCLYRCGNERYLLQVHAPVYKEKLFGKAGGR